MRFNSRVALGLGGVVASMALLFTVPPRYFAPATFFSTGCMLMAAYAMGALRPPRSLNYRGAGVGAVSALALYLIFYLGAATIDALHPLGITSASESSIYALISSSGNPAPLQVALLFFDAAGYESFFRGTLQKALTPRLGLGSAPAVALLDAAVHVLTFNVVWVGATFVTDVVWGLAWRYGEGTQSSFASHFIWDLAIFIVRPVM